MMPVPCNLIGYGTKYNSYRCLSALRGGHPSGGADTPRVAAGQVTGVTHTQTLILPSGQRVPRGFREVGRLVRREAERLIVGYTFDLRANTLRSKTVPNPGAGREHEFSAWRVAAGSVEPVVLREALASDGAESEEDGQ
jgi:hypothetical protein